MELNSIVVKESPGLCRCCLSEGCYKDLATEYPWMSETEVYADMLLECFDISITQNSEGPNGPKRLICEVCITRLRDACNFKKQVLNSEKKFVDMVARKHFQPKAMLVYEAHEPMKTEIDLEPMPGTSGDLEDVEYLEEDIEYVDDYREETIEDIQEQDITVSELEVKPKKSKKRSVEGKAEKKHKTQSTAINKYKDMEDDEGTRIPWDLRFYVKELIRRSTMTPFRWNNKHFHCLYCSENFTDWRNYIQHYNSHRNIDLDQVLKSVLATVNVIIHFDIRDTKCRQCGMAIQSLDSFIAHLVDVHGFLFDKLYRDLLAPAKMGSTKLHCAFCDLPFVNYNFLNKHNFDVHLSKQKYMCERCGKDFVSKKWLTYHFRSEHTTIGFNCKICGMTTQNYYAYRVHCYTHREKTFKCTLCEMTFFSESRKRQHERLDHRRCMFTCGDCGRGFDSNMALHAHLRDRGPSCADNNICDFCNYSFVNKQVLMLHIAAHIREKANAVCKRCNRQFRSERSLALHMAKMHKMKEIALQCSMCGKYLPNKNFLKKHMETHFKTVQTVEDLY